MMKRRSFLKLTGYGTGCALIGRRGYAENEDLLEAYRNMPKVDTHFHTSNRSLDYMKQVQQDNFQLVEIAVDHSEIPLQIECIQLACKQYPQRVHYVTTFPMQGWDKDDWVKNTLDHLDREFDSGAIGVKIWKNIGMVYRDKDDKIVMVDDERFDPIWDKIVDRNKTLIAHLADPRDSWLPYNQMRNPGDKNYFSNNPEYHMYQHPEFPSNEDILAARDRMLKRHPNIRFVGAHLGSLEWDLKRLGQWLDKFPTAAVDLAGRVDDLQLHHPDELHAFMLKYQDRLLYATDLSVRKNTNLEGFQKQCHDIWFADWVYFSSSRDVHPREDIQVRGLNLPPSAMEKLYYSNAKKWFPGVV